jgi:hypothetical protein
MLPSDLIDQPIKTLDDTLTFRCGRWENLWKEKRSNVLL